MRESILNRSKFLDRMSGDEFFRKIVRGPAKTRAFSRLIMAGPEFAHPKYYEDVRVDLIEAGVPPRDIDTDEKLYDVVRLIAARCVAVR